MCACSIIIKYLVLNKKYMKTERTFSTINIQPGTYRMDGAQFYYSRNLPQPGHTDINAKRIVL